MIEGLSLRRLDPDSQRPPFDCGDDDLNDYFHTDSILAGQELLAVTYLFEMNDEPVAFISVSNDSIQRELLTGSRYKKATRFVPRRKRYSSMPAVKIGRLATSAGRQSNGVGAEVLNFMKYWFTHGNKTGCRFIIVDAYNTEKVVSFYQRNGFDFLVTSSDKKDTTRLMYFDLATFRE